MDEWEFEAMLHGYGECDELVCHQCAAEAEDRYEAEKLVEAMREAAREWGREADKGRSDQ